MPTVSIALACYNGARFLEAQLNSLRQQTWPDYELVIVDDASTDNTAAILAKFQTEHPGTRIYRNEQNLGYVRNFEKALTLCSGDFILLCDQDDIWETTKIESLVSHIQKTGALLIYSDAVLTDDADNIIHPSLWEHLELRDIGDNRSALYLRNAVTGCTCILDRKLLSLALPIPENFPVHDWWLAFVALQHGGLQRLDKKLTRYRQHTGNALGTNILSKGRSDEQTLPQWKWLWLKFISPWKKNIERIRKSRIQAKNFQLTVYRAFDDYNRNHQLDIQISSKLAEWSIAYTTRISLKDFQPFFNQHPELFALVEDATIMRKQVLKSMRLRQIKAIKAMALYSTCVAAFFTGTGWLIAHWVH